MPENYTPSGGVGSVLIRATSAEATGDFGADFMRTNVTRIADKARYLNDDGTTSPESWLSATLVNSWVAGLSTGYRKARDGRVQLRGRISSGSGQCFTLPSGYRPSDDIHIPVTTGIGGSVGTAQLRILTTGAVEVFNGSNSTDLLVSFDAA